MSGFEIRICDEVKGVGMFATKTFNQGDIIFEETPLVAAQFSWNQAYGYLACDHCLKPMESTQENVRRLTARDLVLPFPELCNTDKNAHQFCESCGVGYCSLACKEKAFKEYHKILCQAKQPRLEALVEKWKTSHYPPETTTIMLIVRILAMIEQAEDKELAINTFLEFSHGVKNENEQIMRFLGVEGTEKLKSLLGLLQSLENFNNTQSFLSEEGLRSLFALIGRNGQGIGTSALSDWTKRVENLEMEDEEKKKINNFIDTLYDAIEDHVGSFLNTEGSGLYKQQRCVNHSCTPNAEVTFPYSNSTLALVATSAINCGDEICISYLDECVLGSSRHTRNKVLRENYLFECQCQKCIEQADDPDITSEEESGDSDSGMVY